MRNFKNQRVTVLAIFSFLIIVFVLLNCAGKKPAIWGDAETGYLLSFRPAVGDFYHYQRTMNSVNTSERAGQSFENTSDQIFSFRLDTKSVDSLITFVLTVDTMSFSMKHSAGEMAVDYGDINGKRVQFSMTPMGERREVVEIDSLPTPQMAGRPMPGDAKDRLGIHLFKLPNRPLKIGDTWTETKIDTSTRDDSTRQSTYTSIMDGTTTYTVVGLEMKEGMDCLHLTLETKSMLESTGSMRGTEINTEGESDGSSHVWFAYKEGILVEYSSTSFYEGTTAYSGQMSGTSPSTNESETSLKLIRHGRREK